MKAVQFKLSTSEVVNMYITVELYSLGWTFFKSCEIFARLTLHIKHNFDVGEKKLVSSGERRGVWGGKRLQVANP